MRMYQKQHKSEMKEKEERKVKQGGAKKKRKEVLMDE